MIKRIVPFGLAGSLIFAGVGLSHADAVNTADSSHLQIINQELDQIETYLNSANPSLAKVVAVPAVVVNTPKSKPLTYGNTQYESTARETPNLVSQLVPRKNEFDINPEFYWSQFREVGAFTQKGFMSGYGAKYEHRFSENSKWPINMVGVQAQWAQGKFKQPADNVGFSGVEDRSFDVRAVLGKDFHPWTHVRTTGYVGYGFRYLKDKAAGQDIIIQGNEYLGINSASHYSYLPIGMDFVYQLNPRYSWQANLEYDYLIAGWQVDKFGDAFTSFDSLTLAQKDGFGLRASVRFNWNFEYCTAFAEGFWRYWNIAQSNTRIDAGDINQNPVYESKNTTSEVGLRLGLDI